MIPVVGLGDIREMLTVFSMPVYILFNTNDFFAGVTQLLSLVGIAHTANLSPALDTSYKFPA